MTKAVIFDLDGVLIDSEKIWKKIDLFFIKKYFPGCGDENTKALTGLSIYNIYDKFSSIYKMNPKISREKFINHYIEFGLKEVYSQTNLLPNVKEILDYLLKTNFLLAIASSSPKIWILHAIQKHGLEEYFPQLISGQDFEKSKPAPDIFLATANQLKVSPSDCFVIEDSDNGVIAAKNAKMKVAGLRNGFNEQQTLAEADYQINNLLEIRNFL